MSNRFKPGVFTRAAMAGVLAAGLVPCAAFAGTSSGDASDDASTVSAIAAMAEQQAELLDALDATGSTNLLYASNDVDGTSDAALASESWPSSYDLREKGLVTPVKSQLPWGTCWSFAAIATAETSILNKLGLTYDDLKLDLSERQLAWFSQTVMAEGSQAGEGSTAFDPDKRLDTGGTPFSATSIFAQGIGPVLEKDVPYRNNDGEECTASFREIYGDARADAMAKTNPDFDVDGKDCYAPWGDWSVDESYRFKTVLQLEDGSMLTSPATLTRDSSGALKYSYNEAGTAAIKQQLLAGNAVQVCFHADTSRPGESSASKYINTDTWAHYTYEPQDANHAVTIVGWDDDYSKDNFKEGSNTQPLANGAWIVKNSWGSTTEDFPNNNGGWGVDGEGYFYLSYYDQSITDVETFDFDVSTLNSSDDHYIIDSYSFMPTLSVDAQSADDKILMSNIFTAEEDQTVKSLSTVTGTNNVTASYEVYLLDDDATDPTDGKLVARASETYEYSGFHRTDLASGVTMKKGQRYSVVVTQRTIDGRYQFVLPYGLGKEISEKQDSPCYETAVVNEGESILYSEGKWEDWTDSIAEIRKEIHDRAEKQGSTDTSEWLEYDNLPIRSYASPYTTPTFSDVSDDDWFAPAVAKVADAGLMRGYEGGEEFGVGKSLTRAELATILWRDANPADAEAYDRSAANATAMDDVADGAFYTAAANWAVASGVIEGFEMPDGSREFQPDRAVTFEEAVKMIARYHAAMHGADVEGDEAALGGFADAGSVSEWARPYMAWAVESGLVGGYPSGDGYEIRPDAPTPRERAARIVSNALEAGVLD